MTCLRILTLATTMLFPAATLAAEKAATPEELVAFWQAALKSGDLKAQLHLFGGPHRKLNEQALEVLEAAKAFDKALDDKFGQDLNCRSFVAVQSKPIKRVELRGKKDIGGGKVELTIWCIGETVVESREVAIWENGGWVMLAPVPFTLSTSMEETRGLDGREVKVQVVVPSREVTPAQLVAARAALPKMRAAFERGAKDVAAGKHANRKAAVTAVDKAVEEVMTGELDHTTSGDKKEPK